MHAARRLSEELADEQKHQLLAAREELRVAEHKLQDAVAAQERTQALLDSKSDLTYNRVRSRIAHIVYACVSLFLGLSVPVCVLMSVCRCRKQESSASFNRGSAVGAPGDTVVWAVYF